MRIRTLAGPPFEHETVRDVLQSILLVEASVAAAADNMTPGDDAAIEDAAHVLREKIDILLDRLTDVVLRSPAPGTAQWRNLVRGPGDLTRITRGARRADVRALIAEHAGVADPGGTLRCSSTPVLPVPRRRRGRRADPAQLTFF